MAGKVISVIGSGYVGLCTALALAKKGFRVHCVDVVPERVKMINGAQPPIYELGLEELLKEMVSSGRLTATTDTRKAILESDISLICVPTPSQEDGSIDLSFARKAAADIGKALADFDGYHVVTVKSTVVPGTAANLVRGILEKESGKKAPLEFGLCSNPEFLREGLALYDSLNPDRIVIGAIDDKAGDTLQSIYAGYDAPVVRVDLSTAEMIKYASNSFLSTKITFANEVANICELYGVDVYRVMDAVGMDTRIGPAFLRAGAGYGGSCFPKDVPALIHAAKIKGYTPLLLESVVHINRSQPLRVVELALKALDCGPGGLQGKRVAFLGLAFKPDSDDVRESKAFPIIEALVGEGARVVAFDPKAADNFRREAEFDIEYAESLDAALQDADLCILQTEWKEFRDLTSDDFKCLMKAPIVVDGRRTLDPERMLAEGVKYWGIGWKNEG